MNQRYTTGSVSLQNGDPRYQTDVGNELTFRCAAFDALGNAVPSQEPRGRI